MKVCCFCFCPSASTQNLANPCQALITNHQHQHPITPASTLPSDPHKLNITLCHKAFPVLNSSSLWVSPPAGVTSLQQPSHHHSSVTITPGLRIAVKRSTHPNHKHKHASRNSRHTAPAHTTRPPSNTPSPIIPQAQSVLAA